MAVVEGERWGRSRAARARPTVAPAETPATNERGKSVLRRDLRAILADGAAFSLMVGIGETYLPAFALAVGINEVAAGLVATVPLLAGALLQLASPRAIRSLGSHRRWVVMCAATQAASFVPLLVAICIGHVPAALVFVAASVYWGAGLATGPAWSTWVGTLVPGHVRANYFARRTRVAQGAVLLGFVAGGLTLQAGAAVDARVYAFAVLFLVASACRFVSAWHLARQSEPVPPDERQRRVPVRELLARLRNGSDGRLLAYLLAVQAAVQISSPYFTPFMLKQLHFSYVQFVLLVGVSYLAKVVSLPTWGRVARRCGPHRLLWIGGLGIVPLSGMWVVSTSFPFLLALQVAGGVAWAAYELAIFLLFFEAIAAEERTSVLTSYNLAHAVATAGGSLLGGLLLAVGGKQAAAYLAVFALSSLARVAGLALLVRVPHAAPRAATLGTRILALPAEEAPLDKGAVASVPRRRAA